jgi:hypothetical protein
MKIARDAGHIVTLETPKDVVVRADAVASAFKGRAQAAQLVLVDGAIGQMWVPGGQPHKR